MATPVEMREFRNRLLSRIRFASTDGTAFLREGLTTVEKNEGRLTAMSMFERPDVVRSVPAHEGRVAQALVGGDDELLLLWGHTGEDLDVGEHLAEERGVFLFQPSQTLREEQGGKSQNALTTLILLTMILRREIR